MHRYSRGISLIEALITLLILSIGLLGLGQLQARLWSSSARLHATGNAYLLGSEYLEIVLTRQVISAELVTEPPPQVLRAGTLFDTTASFDEIQQLTRSEIRIEWQNRSGPEVLSLESSINTSSRAPDTRLLLPTD